MKLRLFIALLFLTSFLSGTLKAERVDEAKARKAALNHYRHYAPASKQQADITKVKEYKWGDRTSFYICSFDKGGFVLVSANDQVTPVLGYGFEHGVPDEITNEAVKTWFDGYARQIDTVFVLNLKNDDMAAKWQDVLEDKLPAKNGNSVGPLLTTTWDQGWPYNAMCPEDPNGSGGHTLAGCVAVALAQILKYHNYPEKGNGFFSYLDYNNHLVSANFDTTFYKWPSMPANLFQSDTTYSEIATLIYNCGVSTRSNYSNTETSGLMSEEPLLNIFGYAYSSIKRYYRNTLTQIQWDSILINELNENRPIYYEGFYSIFLGHAFVCDGYDGNGYFHFNFGWSGQGDGYYISDSINPFWWNFNDYQNIIIGIKPNDGTNILGDTTFSGIKHIPRSLFVSAFANLTINQGAVLQFDSACHLAVSGSLLSKGTATEPVSFEASDTISKWNGLKVIPSIYQFLMMNEPDTLALIYTNISFSRTNGINIQWPNYGMTHDQVINKGMLLRHARLFKNTGFAVSGFMSGIQADSCQFDNNGGGVFLTQGWLNISNSTIQNNSGPGIDCNNQLDYFWKPSTVSNNLICYNTANTDNKAGGIGLSPGNYHLPGPNGPRSFISGNVISNNTGTLSGGLAAESNVLVINNRIYENAANYGGGVYIGGGATLINNEIYNNTANYHGGAITVESGKIINNLIYNNNSGIAGIFDPNAAIYNNTIINNGSGVSFVAPGIMEIKNNIFWNQGIEINAGTNQVNVSHCVVKGGTENIYATTSLSTMESIIKREPRFINPTTFIGTGEIPDELNWGLNLNSPAIDAAVVDTTGLYLPQIDNYGQPRFNRMLDLGAVENQSDTIFPCFIEDGYTLNECIGNQVQLIIPYRGENCQFEWYKNDSINLGINNDTLTIYSLSEADSGKYFCIVSNPLGKDTSDIISVNVFFLPPGNPSSIHGHATIHHFEKELVYWTKNIPNCTKLQWIASPGLSFFTTNDTTINVKVIDTISSGIIKFFGKNPCGSSSDTAILNLTVLRMPDIFPIIGDSSLCAGHSYLYWDNRYIADFNYQYDMIQWQIPPGMTGGIAYQEGWMFIDRVDSLAQSDTLKARWVKEGYGVGQWSPFPIHINHSAANAANAIYGANTICAGTSNVIYSTEIIPNAETYLWSLPPGATGSSITNSISVNFGLNAVSGEVSVHGVNDCGEGAVSSMWIHVDPHTNEKHLQLNVFLEGAYNASGGSMNTSLNQGSLIPLSQSYNQEPWNYTGTETLASIPTNAVDWVLVELRQASSPDLATQATTLEGWPRALVLHQDGTIVDIYGSAPLIGNATISENLYVVIRHRNHIDIMSNEPLALSGNIYSFNFTQSISTAYGGALGYKELATGIYGMVAGDGDADGSVYMSDRTVWRNSLGVVSSYESSDYDMDGNSFMSDRTLWRGNLGVTNPLSQSVSAPLYKSQVPEDN